MGILKINLNFVKVFNLFNCFIVFLLVGLILNKEFKKNNNIGFINLINGYRYMCVCRVKKKISLLVEKVVNKSIYLVFMYICNILFKFSLYYFFIFTAKVVLNMVRLILLLL